MYKIYTTPGFVIHSRAYGEAGKILSIFTKDLGLVLATAQGIRLEKSKLRYYTQDYAFGKFSLIKGKEYWRLTSADSVAEYGSNENVSELMVRIAALLRRLLHGEEPNERLFGVIEDCKIALCTQEFSAEQLKTLESVIVLRILNELGYIGNDSEIDDGIRFSPITVDLLDSLSSKRTLLNRHINRAFRESHL